ncbi:MAG: hypothetical protein GWN64_07750 [Candidatus Thorarchaeota archaeon]|nr:hypothetical protein [Candidatus Thorarchaeota archaeon]
MPEFTITELDYFKKFFSGNTSAYGRHIYSSKKKGGQKREGQSFTIKEPLTDAQYIAHLEGKEGLGVIPINANNKCRFFVLDVDDYTGREDIIQKIYDNAFPIVPFRSKSDGLHLYCFLDKLEPADKAIKIAKAFIPILGLANTTEIFPKQFNLKEGQIGNWINIPYYGGHNSRQAMVAKDNKLIAFSEAMYLIDKAKQRLELLENFLGNTELCDAPPCLQSIYYEKDTDFRNQYLFSLCRYLKAKHGDEFDILIQKYNLELGKPIPANELDKTIVSSHKKKDYSYRCTEEPLCSHCNKNLCRERKYGIGGEEVSELNFEQFIQYTSDPPYYEWVINGSSMKFYAESDIINQLKFRELCFRRLHVLPPRMKDAQWTKIINRALKNIEIVKIEEHDDMSTGSMFKELLYEFFERRAQAETKREILFDKVYKDQAENEYIFRSKALSDFLINVKNFRFYTMTEIQDRLKLMGGRAVKAYISKSNPTCRVWKLPLKALAKFMHAKIKEDEFEVDFAKGEEDGKEEMY